MKTIVSTKLPCGLFLILVACWGAQLLYSPPKDFNRGYATCLMDRADTTDIINALQQ